MSLHMEKAATEADVETKDCPECGREFVPKRKDQPTCGTPACNGAIGASKRDYRKKSRG